MMVAINADIYAVARLNIFFPANNSTPTDGNLTGQCVTLEKWFTAEMCNNFPSPFVARGDARYVGDNLVAQGLATIVPAGRQRRGDLVVYKYGQYGHIGILLSGNRLFQENANAAGATRKVLPNGTVVYSSTIVTVYPSLGGVAPTYYRLNSYIERDDMAKFTKEQEQTAALMATGSVPGNAYDYPFTQDEVTSDTLNVFLQTWQNRVSLVTADMERTLAKMATGSPYGKDYNSQFQGKPVLTVLPDMLAFWLGQRQDTLATGTVLKPGNYKVN